MLLTGTDFETAFELVYHLYSYRHHHRLTSRCALTTTSGRRGLGGVAVARRRLARARSREMLGIDFPGNPDLRPLLLDDDVDEYPLRRSHKLMSCTPSVPAW